MERAQIPTIQAVAHPMGGMKIHTELRPAPLTGREKTFHIECRMGCRGSFRELALNVFDRLDRVWLQDDAMRRRLSAGMGGNAEAAESQSSDTEEIVD